MRVYVRRSVMSVHMVGAVEGFIPESSNGRSVVRIQLDVALEDHHDAQFKRVVWVPEGRPVIEARQREFVKQLQNDPDVLRRIELVQGKLVESLKTTILDLLEPKDARAAAAGANGSAGENPPRLYTIDMRGADGETGADEVTYRVAAFSPDGKTLALTAGDSSVRLWNIATQQPVLTLEVPRSWAFSETLCENINVLAFSADGQTLLAGGETGRVHLWRAPRSPR